MTDDGGWLLLIHQIPPKPDYLRVKIGRRLARVGAVAIKNSVYALPASPQALEDLEWIRTEVVDGGGEAVICQASFVSGLSDDDLRERFRTPAMARATVGAEHYRARTWVTREGVFVDRIGSAWLIRRFIDPEARFKFVPARGYRPKTDELRFDMFEAEFTHEGDRCTFETLLARFALDDAALREIAEIVHDIDLKDAKFERGDAAGIERVLAGIAGANVTDDARLERGAQLFDALYESFTTARTTND